MKKKSVLYMFMAIIVLLSTACGKTEDDNRMVITEPVVEKVEVNPSAQEKSTSGETSSEQGEASAADAVESRAESEAENDAETAAMKEKFGEDCIAQQTFEV